MQVLHSPTNKRFLYSFWALRNRLIKDIGSKLRASHDIDMADMFLLQHVLEHDLSPSELAEAIQIPAHGISRMLEGLESEGLLERKLHPQDARKRVLTVTEKGKKALQAARTMMDTELQTFLSVLDEPALEQFIENLEKLAQVDSS
jgi:DNA-binding MarR family transcriptional regulator